MYHKIKQSCNRSVKLKQTYLSYLEQTLTPFAAKVPSHVFTNARRTKLAVQRLAHKNETTIFSSAQMAICRYMNRTMDRNSNQTKCCSTAGKPIRLRDKEFIRRVWVFQLN